MPRASVDNLDTRKKTQEAFLAAYAQTGIISAACQAANISRQTYYNWYNGDDEFRERAKEAKQAATDAMEYEAWRRAVQGDEKPYYYQGRVVGNIREYSDNLLMFLLKSRDPDRFKDHVSAEVRGEGLTIIIGGQEVGGKA